MALCTLRELQVLGWIIGNQTGEPGAAEQLPEDAAHLLHMGAGHAGLGIENPLQVYVPHILELHVADGWLDVFFPLLVVHAKALRREALLVLVGGFPLLVPGIHRHGAVYGLLAPFGCGQLFRKPG